MAAFDCSTKSRAREIPRTFQDGRPAPQPLRTESQPEGLPNLSARDAQRVRVDNQACAFVLDEIQGIQARGGISIRENPLRSLHWHLSQEKEMMASGHWNDTIYAACCFGGARCKMQRLRHNVDEIAQWPPCHHSHDPREWEPWSDQGERIYPSKLEAEYTAPLAFAIAVAASWWAARVGRAKLHVPRAPSISCVGRREHWLSLDPRALREWAMTPLAITLGLEPLDPVEKARVPKRARVQDVLLPDGSIPGTCIYVGLGHHSHRLPTTCWKSPWVPGHSCTHDEWLPLYVEHVRSTELWDHLPQLAGKTLVCDCDWQSLCEADVLAGLCFDRASPLQQRPWRGGTSRSQDTSQTRAVVLASSMSSACASSVPTQLCRRSQESVVLQFQKLFPEPWLASITFPMIEDLINMPPFGLFEQWLEAKGLVADGPLGPALATQAVRLAQRSTEAQQAGAFNQRAALPPLLRFGLSPDDHFEAARLISQSPLPTERPSSLDPDLHFAAEMCKQYRGSLRSYRESFIKLLRELQRRWTPVSSHLRSLQPSGIQAVTAKRDLGFTALLIVLCSWPDVSYPFGLIRGLPAVGYAPCYNIFPELSPGSISFDEVMGDWQSHNFQIESTLKPGPHDEFTLHQSCLDADKGFCSYPLTKSELCTNLHGSPFRLIPRCVITQSSGKQRVIDDAHRGGQSETSRDSNKLVLCSALRPAQHVQALLQGISPADMIRLSESDSLESGGEDWPDAYRHSPMSTFEASHCIVTWWHPDWQCPAYQIYHGLLFGLPLAVTSFNRYSRLSETLGRRLLWILVSMYFDDAHLTDWASSRGSAQASFKSLNDLLGTPFAEDKRQPMSHMGVFLGLEHDMSQALTQGVIHFWAKDKLVDKLRRLLQEAHKSEILTPGQASKIYGLANFFEQGVYGRVGTGGLNAIKERQYERASHVTPAILTCLEVLEAIIQNKPQRLFPVQMRPHPRFCAASDAALEAPGCGTGGFLLVWFNGDQECREAFIADLPPELYDLWTAGDKKIAQLELIQILYALVARPTEFRERRGVWFIDNIAALMALIRGRSDAADLEHLAHLIHVACFSLRVWMYWEYIPSKSNWADAISRLGEQDPWHAAHSFSLYRTRLPLILWSLPFAAAVTVFEML